jgi:hypothetical protein
MLVEVGGMTTLFNERGADRYMWIGCLVKLLLATRAKVDLALSMMMIPFNEILNRRGQLLERFVPSPLCAEECLIKFRRERKRAQDANDLKTD